MIQSYTIVDESRATHKVIQYLHGKSNPEQEAVVVYGECLCESCDKTLAKENETINIGFKCWNCGTPVLRFDPI
jgi:predicted RNA-binding Zn-ribbon protein involved in translation (DUF1610 family)